MKKNYLFLPIIFIIVLAVFVILNTKNSQNNSSVKPTPQEEQKTFQTQTSDKGAVIVEATPLILEAGKEISFELKLNTHTAPLDYDLIQISKLKDNQGNIYQALSWDGGKEGHHLSGILKFPKISEQAASVTLLIPGIDNEDREFTWNF